MTLGVMTGEGVTSPIELCLQSQKLGTAIPSGPQVSKGIAQELKGETLR